MMVRRRVWVMGLAAAVMALPATVSAQWWTRPGDRRLQDCEAERAKFQDALERIAMMDEADGHELSVKQAFEATGLASRTLGKHPSQILADRLARGLKF